MTVVGCATTRALPLAITMGDPAGIGTETVLEAWRRRALGGPAFFLIDEPGRVAELARDVTVVAIAEPGEASDLFERALPVLPLTSGVHGRPSVPDSRDAPAIVESIERAVAMALAGEASAIVTCPIHKGNLYAAGFAFPGHTELLGHLTGVERPVMMLAAGSLRVVPVTIHEPLRRVSGLLTEALIVETAVVVDRALRERFGIARPRLVLAGLNPHAGEGGALGREEIEVVAPAVRTLRGRGIDASGPFPADSMFHAAARRGFDAALCMYHDQAMLPIKTLAFDEAVNVTLGLPLVRTSPDHGTAFDIAGRGIARAHSMIAAIGLAARLAGQGSELELDAA